VIPSLTSRQHNTPAEALISYIFEVGQLANNKTISLPDVQYSKEFHCSVGPDP
jgi:hypothetical protein